LFDIRILGLKKISADPGTFLALARLQRFGRTKNRFAHIASACFLGVAPLLL
jgi:hypothetical protein